MGMSTQQLLCLTARRIDITGEEQRIANQKMSLTRDMEKISREYSEKINTKTLKWSSNSGVDYVDLSYNNLMKPSTLNKNNAYILTDLSDRVVIASNYRKYAEIISPDGKPNGDWKSNRTEILASITGISAEKIEGLETATVEIMDYQDALEDIQRSKPSNDKYAKVNDTDGLLSKLGSTIGGGLTFSAGSNWKDAYNKEANIVLGSGASASGYFDTIFSKISELAKYFPETSDKFLEACEAKKTELKNFVENKIDLSKSGGELQGADGSYKVNVKGLLDSIFAVYQAKGGECTTTAYKNELSPVWFDVESDGYKEYQGKLDAWQAEYDDISGKYDSSTEKANTLLTANEESLIEFYDNLFSTIAEKGWTYNNQIQEDDYLDQMLQNNLYRITTVDRELKYDPDNREHNWKNSYETDIASNMANVYTVNDSDARNEALVEYEHKKNLINKKESRLDVRLQNLQTELSAITQMLQSIENIRNENIERNFSIFS